MVGEESSCGVKGDPMLSESKDFLSDLTFEPAGVRVGNSGVALASPPPDLFFLPRTSQVEGVAANFGVGGKDDPLRLSRLPSPGGVVAVDGEACSLWL